MNYNRSISNNINNTSSSNNNNFNRTCSRLSQFMKERRRSLGEQSCFAFPRMAPLPSPKPADPKRVEEEIEKKDGALSLYPDNKGKEEKASAFHSVDPDENRKSVELLFQLTNPSTSQQSPKPNITNVRELSRAKEEAKSTSASMTIFYGGKVMVFDDFPEGKAEEIISLATSQGTKKSTYPQTSMETQTQTPSPSPSPTPATATATPINKMNVIGTQHKQDTVSQDQVGGPSDLPIARRTSLFRFIEKRKDRVASAAPYQLQNSSRGADHIENSNPPPENSNRQRYNVVMRNLCQQQQEEQKQKQLLELKNLRQRKEEEQKQKELLELRKLCQRQEEELKKQKRLLELQQREEERKQKRLLELHQQQEDQKQKGLLEMKQREEEQKQKLLLGVTNLSQQQQEEQKQKQLLELKL